MFANNVPKKKSNIKIRRPYKWNDHAIAFEKVDNVMCFKHLSFLFLVQKKKLVVNVGEKWNLKSSFVIDEKLRQYCVNEKINH